MKKFQAIVTVDRDGRRILWPGESSLKWGSSCGRWLGSVERVDTYKIAQNDELEEYTIYGPESQPGQCAVVEVYEPDNNLDNAKKSLCHLRNFTQEIFDNITGENVMSGDVKYARALLNREIQEETAQLEEYLNDLIEQKKEEEKV